MGSMTPTEESFTLYGQEILFPNKGDIIMDQNISYGSDYKYIPATSVMSGKEIEILTDIYSYTIQIVNICFVGYPYTNEFVLIDAGMPHSADEIILETENRFGVNSKPKAIVLTHGHFDHVGAIIELLRRWQVPIYAHKLEIPYLTGKKSYPKPDPTVNSGLIAKLSPMFPNEPINLENFVEELPSNGTVPYLPEFRWIHTPGHTPGHTSFFREKDRVLIAGDAFVTVKQESLYQVITMKQEISGPPKYFTQDWAEAFESVKKLQELNPAYAITGHGLPMSGSLLRGNLQKLVEKFDEIALPTNKSLLN